jgi:pimeloyl-ACP methyl ester carboxylesterase
MPEWLIVGKEREFLTWFYEGATHDKGASIEEAAVSEYLRTFSGAENIRGSFGIYREIFTSIKQTEKFDGLFSKIGVPVLALGGELGLGKLVKPMLEGVASHVQGEVIADCEHFIQEEQPEHLLKLINDFMTTINS